MSQSNNSTPRLKFLSPKKSLKNLFKSICLCKYATEVCLNQRISTVSKGRRHPSFFNVLHSTAHDIVGAGVNEINDWPVAKQIHFLCLFSFLSHSERLISYGFHHHTQIDPRNDYNFGYKNPMLFNRQLIDSCRRVINSLDTLCSMRKDSNLIASLHATNRFFKF